MILDVCKNLVFTTDLCDVMGYTGWVMGIQNDVMGYKTNKIVGLSENEHMIQIRAWKND